MPPNPRACRPADFILTEDVKKTLRQEWRRTAQIRRRQPKKAADGNGGHSGAFLGGGLRGCGGFTMSPVPSARRQAGREVVNPKFGGFFIMMTRGMAAG